MPPIRIGVGEGSTTRTLNLAACHCDPGVRRYFCVISRPQSPDRFHEDNATFTVTGSQPDIDAGVEAIRTTLKTLPTRPGVYRMQDARGDVLYVGKARALRNRVTNYTQVDRLPKRLQRMVAQTRSMTIVTTNSEAEALLLEAELYFIAKVFGFMPADRIEPVEIL